MKYFGNTIDSKAGINQETCALLCFKKPACTHWTYNPTYEGGKISPTEPPKNQTTTKKSNTASPRKCGETRMTLLMTGNGTTSVAKR